MTAPNDDYKNPQTLTNWTKGFLYTSIGVSVVLIGSNLLEFQLLVAIRDGFYPDASAIERSDARQALLEVLGAVVVLPSMVFVLIWIYRANYNLRQLGAVGLKYSPAGSIGWYFVPILSLWRPYSAMKEIYQASLNPHEWEDKPVPTLLPMWWTLWLVSIALNNLDVRLWWRLDENSSVPDFIAANLAAQAALVSDIPLTLVLLVIINRIYRMQGEYRRQRLDTLR